MDSKQEFTVMLIQRLLRPVQWKKPSKIIAESFYLHSKGSALWILSLRIQVLFN